MSNGPVRAKPNARRGVFVVDDHPLVREWLGTLIERQPDLALAGHAETSAEAYEAIGRLKPDIVIVDVTLEGRSGLELIKQLQELPAPPPAIVLSMHDETLFAERALRAGARGYVMKRSATRDVIDAIRQVLLGKLYLSAAVSAQLAARYVGTKPNEEKSSIARLSDRELDVFRLLGRGFETRKIGEELHLSPKTVQVYYGRMKEKLGVANATELLREAVRWAEAGEGG